MSYRNGQLGISGIDIPLSPWDSYGLSKYQIGAGSISKDARGRWYINMTVKVARELPSQGKADLGIDLSLKDFAAFSDQSIDNVEAKCYYRALEPKLAVAHRANKKRLVKKIHAKVAKRRKDHHHQLSTCLVKRFSAILSLP